MRELVRALATLPEGPELRLFDVGPGRPSLPPGALGLSGREHRLRLALPRRVLPLLARAGLAADRLLGGVDLFHRAFPALPPVARAPEVLPLFELPEPGSSAERDLAPAIERARVTVVFSAAAARELCARGLSADRLATLPVGCDHWQRDLRGARVTPVGRVLALGALDRAPFLDLLVRAVGELRARGHDLELVLAGRAGPRALPAAPFARHVPPREADLPTLLAGSAVLAYLPRQAWTPVTPLEAFSLGAAVCAPRLPALEEALGDRASWVELAELESGDPAGLAHGLERALEGGLDPAARAARAAHAAPFTWEQHARLTAALWLRILAA